MAPVIGPASLTPHRYLGIQLRTHIVHGREVRLELRPLILRMCKIRLQCRQCAIRIGAIRLPFVAFVNQLSALFAERGIGVFGVRQSGLELVARLRCDGGVGMSDTYTDSRKKAKTEKNKF
jgi:hypothetical protein